MRELERRSLNDPEARIQLAQELGRLGYREIVENFAKISLTYASYTPDQFLIEINKKIKEKHRQQFHRIQLYFDGHADCSSSYDPYDNYSYCDNSDVSVHVTLQGVRMETEKEFQKRTTAEQKQQEEARRLRNQQAQARRLAKMQAKELERETYERLKRKFETEDKIEKLLVDIGEEAEAALREYSPSYFKSWFNRSFKKLGGKTPLQVYEEEDVETLRLFALKRL